MIPTAVFIILPMYKAVNNRMKLPPVWFITAAQFESLAVVHVEYIQLCHMFVVLKQGITICVCILVGSMFWASQSDWTFNLMELLACNTEGLIPTHWSFQH